MKLRDIPILSMGAFLCFGGATAVMLPVYFRFVVETGRMPTYIVMFAIFGWKNTEILSGNWIDATYKASIVFGDFCHSYGFDYADHVDIFSDYGKEGVKKSHFFVDFS